MATTPTEARGKIAALDVKLVDVASALNVHPSDLSRWLHAARTPPNGALDRAVKAARKLAKAKAR